jgi:shikimate dehydrogenase
MRKFGLIGKSLAHSWSGQYYSQKFAAEGLHECSYQNFPLDDLLGFRQLVKDDQSLCGLNVTNPYKLEIIRHIDELDALPEDIGAVNCIRITRSNGSIRMKGYNTDAAAFRETLRHLVQGNHDRALVLGSGGASRAVCHALKELNTGFTLVSRSGNDGKLTYADISNQVISEHRIIINTTPVGMHPGNCALPPLPYKTLTTSHLLYDLIYNPGETQFLKMGREAGASVKNGLEMLHRQAELSWEIWNGN